MKKVDFYILNDAGKLPAWRFLCTLIEKAYSDQESVFVYTASKTDAEFLDNLLWTYKEDSFLPHHLVEVEAEANITAPITISYQQAPPKSVAVLVNLSPEIPVFYECGNRIIEIVFSDATVQQLARERFRQYREKNCELTTHKINTSERLDQ